MKLVVAVQVLGDTIGGLEGGRELADPPLPGEPIFSLFLNFN